jgi:hypothetical protein
VTGVHPAKAGIIPAWWTIRPPLERLKSRGDRCLGDRHFAVFFKVYDLSNRLYDCNPDQFLRHSKPPTCFGAIRRDSRRMPQGYC